MVVMTVLAGMLITDTVFEASFVMIAPSGVIATIRG